MATNSSYKTRSQGYKPASSKNPSTIASNPSPTGKVSNPGGVPTDTEKTERHVPNLG